MGGPPRGMMHGPGGGPWGGGPPHHGGWDEEGGDYDEMMEMGGRPDMMQQRGGPSDESSNPLGIDLSGEVWVETKTEEGKSYFYNARTRETTWSRPEETKGVRILSQTQVEQLTQQLAGSEAGSEQKPAEDGSSAPPFGMPPPSFMGGPPGFMPPGGGPPGGVPFGMPPPGFPPPWGMPPPGGIAPPWATGASPVPFMEPCDWSEHTSPDGKKYYYNAKSGESVWEKPKELADFEKRSAKGPAGASGMTPNPVPAVSAPAKLTDAANMNIAANGEDRPVAIDKHDDVAKQDASKSAVAAAATTTAAVAAVTTTAVMSAADKSKPVSSSPVSGTPWCVVWTGDNRVFFYNPTTKTSVWERPPELVGRADVSEMMK